MIMRRDYYAVLGVATTADLRDIRRAYRHLARQYSPDINFWDAEARVLFEEISEAYRVLSDPGARTMYDRFGTTLVDRDARPSGRRGDDHHVTVALSFADAATGVTLSLDLSRFSPCQVCEGRGCGGCRHGVRPTTESVSVAIPAGVDTGTQIRVSEQGHAGPFGGPRGDLILSTRVSEHSLFLRKGDNLHCEVPITIGEAVLGTRIQVPALDGEATLVIPPGTQSGQAFRLRGRGVPRIHSDGAGDLYVMVRVETPRGLDAHTQELVRELDRLIGGDPRRALRQQGGPA
jgi:molecular chaperone DnaJ